MNKPPKNNVVLTVLELIMAVLLLPFVWSASVSFHKYLMAMPGIFDSFFFWGMFGYLVCYLFVYQFWGVYELGQKITSGLFQFTAPMNDFVAKVIPFYLTAILLLHFVMVSFFKVHTLNHYFMFFAGFSFAMHVVLSAQDLQQTEHSFIKPKYLFHETIALILLLTVTVLLLDLVLGKWLFPDFFRKAVSDGLGIYYETGESLGIFR